MNHFLARRFLISGMVMLAGCGGGSGSSGTEPPLFDPSPLSGVINIEAGSRIDQDTMDQLGLDEAVPSADRQLLPDSFVLAGYVSSRSGSYRLLEEQVRPFEFEVDPEDRYAIQMEVHDTVLLESFGSRSGNPQLEIELSSNGRVISSAQTSNTVSSVTVNLMGETPGEYELSVRVIGDGASRYVIGKAANASTDGLAFDWPAHEFMPGEAIVSMAPTQGQVEALSGDVGILMRHLGKDDWLVSMPIQALSRVSGQVMQSRTTLDWIQSLRKRPDMVTVHPHYVFRSQASPVDDPGYFRNWHYDLINGPTAWQISDKDGTGVSVAVLDSGLLRVDNRWHFDLNSNVTEGFDFIDNDSIPEDKGSNVGGDVFHGTHVAGTIAALVNDQGIGGVAFNSNIVPVKVLEEGGTGSSLDLIKAIRWVTGETNGGLPKADIVNMSLGGLPRIEDLEEALEEGVKRGVIFVAAAGNSASSVPSFPAASDNVLSVSAVDAGGKLASYSNFGLRIDLAAPGGDASRDGNLDGQADLVWSTSGERQDLVSVEGYRGLQGTSMASPHVAGVLALMKAESPELDYPTVLGWLRDGRLTQGDGSRNDQLGWGIIDAAKSVSEAATGEPVTLLYATPALVSLSNEGPSSQTVWLQVYGAEAVLNERVTSTPDWLQASLFVSPENGDLELYLSLIPDALSADQSMKENVVIDYQVGSLQKTLSVPVIGQLISDERARNAGRHFVLLVNTEPTSSGIYAAEAQVAVDVNDGVYEFRFEPYEGNEPKRQSEVRTGDYFLVAGTDIDGDGLICQAGEACAEYPIAGLREVITIEEGQGLSDIKMTTSFSRPTISASTPDVLPRPGFRGYRLITQGRASAPGDHQPRTIQ